MTNSDDLYAQILSSEPSPRTIWLVLSKLKEEGQLSRVIEECLRALESYPHDVHLRQLLADAYFEGGFISEAEAELDKVTTQIGDLISAFRLKAEICWKQNRKEEAQQALKLYLTHRPDDQRALHLLETFSQKEAALPDDAPPVVEEVPSSPEQAGLTEIATPTLAEIYFNQGQMQAAIDTYERLVAQNPEDQSSRTRLEELKTLLLADARIEEKGVDNLRQKKEKMIAVLESWLANIRARNLHSS